MKQTDLGLNLGNKRTRKREFLGEMDRVVPWDALVELISPYAPEGKTGRPPFAVQSMLRIHFLQQWFGLSDPAMEEALHDVPLYREFAGLDGWTQRLPDETTILRFRHLLQKHKLADQMLATVNEVLRAKGLMLRAGTVVDATLIGAPSSTKNAKGERDPEMHQVKKGNQWYFGMKAHIGVDSKAGIVHTAVATAANVSDSAVLPELLHGNECKVWGDAAYQGQGEKIRRKAPRAQDMTSRRTRYKHFVDELQRRKNRTKAHVRSKVEHVFRVMKRQFGFDRVRYRGLAKNANRMFACFALVNLYITRKRLAPLGA